MIVRPMLAADLDQIVEIEKASMPSPWSKELFDAELQRSQARYFVAEDKGKVIGYMGYWEAPEEAHIINLAVAPQARQKGVGFEMMNHCLGFAYSKGARLATLEVRAGNEAAQKLYEKMNFRTVAIRKKYYSDNQEDAIVMLRELEA